MIDTSPFPRLPWRPWPTGVEFATYHHSGSKWLDLLYIRPSDGARVYLSTILYQPTP